MIVPCGISDKGVTALELAAGRPVSFQDVMDRLALDFAEVFDRASAPGAA
jgi:lipoate-protein ligase B